ncbi:MAG: glycosyltransferase family 4 protein [Candidatus Thorarchaeota archaeon]
MSRVNRIAVFVEHFPPYLGSDRSVYELAIRAARRGIDIHFIATQPLRYLLGERPSDWPYVKNWVTPPDIKEPNVTFEYLLLNRYLLAMWRRLPPIALMLTILLFTFYGIRAMLNFRPDVVVSAHASPIVGGVALLSSKFTFCPLVMSCPDWMSAYAAGLIDKKVGSWGPALLQLVEILLYRLSKRIFTATWFLKNLLVGYGINPHKIDVIQNGVDPDFFRPDVDTSSIVDKYRLANRIVILFTGHLEDWAGVSIIYNLAEKLDKAHNNSVILLVGAGEPSGDLFKKLIASNLGYIVVHAGLHPFKEMPAFTAAADIALCIFPNTPVSHAASPLKLFEYMASGNAIVATKVAGTIEVMKEELGVLVPPDDIEAICNAVLTLCNDEPKRKKIGASARADVVMKYSWNRLSERFIDVCRTAL